MMGFYFWFWTQPMLQPKNEQQFGHTVACQEFNLPVGVQYSHNCTGVTTGANLGPGKIQRSGEFPNHALGILSHTS